MRAEPTLLHLDMDAFYASAEQAAKPSLRGKAVVVGGVGARGVVATASYEARRFGIRSAMPVAQARRLCPNAAYLHPRFSLYRDVSGVVMGLLGALSPLVEPLSLDEAFVDLAAGAAADGRPPPAAAECRAIGTEIRAAILRATGLSASVGLAGSKMLAKIASEQAKPDGLLLLEPGSEREYLAPLPVRTLPGVGPATDATLRRAGIVTVGDAVTAGRAELVRLLGQAHGTAVHDLSRGLDDRPVVAERDAKSVSVEDTFAEDLTDRTRVRAEVDRLADRCVRRLRDAGRSGRTVVLKVRGYDFTTVTRSETLRGPTDDPSVVREAAARLLGGLDTTAGVRLLGVGVSGLADFTQEDLFAQASRDRAPVPDAAPEKGAPSGGEAEAGAVATGAAAVARRWLPGEDVVHDAHGRGWVQGSGVGRVTVRFETPTSPPGRVRTFATDEPGLSPAEPLPLPSCPPVPSVPGASAAGGSGEGGDGAAGPGPDAPGPGG
ncbi:DNA polymerase IV [Streptomyces sp. SM14]|uniref:DNA polymerase IV n=2 Tax=unclassified Streptomyces TaxID=2593676 RepID=UPI000CD4D911|nr:DNA polymerase IV [Streptomyces sp. SM14]